MPCLSGRGRAPGRVGAGGLRPPEPQRGTVWKPSQGFHHDARFGNPPRVPITDRVGAGGLRPPEPQHRVGAGRLGLPEPQRGKVWKPSQGFHYDAGFGNRRVPITDFRRRRRAPPAGAQHRVGAGRLGLPEPQRGKVWKPSQGFHYDARPGFPLQIRVGAGGLRPPEPAARGGFGIPPRVPTTIDLALDYGFLLAEHRDHRIELTPNFEEADAPARNASRKRKNKEAVDFDAFRVGVSRWIWRTGKARTPRRKRPSSRVGGGGLCPLEPDASRWRRQAWPAGATAREGLETLSGFPLRCRVWEPAQCSHWSHLGAKAGSGGCVNRPTPAVNHRGREWQTFEFSPRSRRRRRALPAGARAREGLGTRQSSHQNANFPRRASRWRCHDSRK